MPMDATAIGIILGTLAAALFALCAFRQAAHTNVNDFVGDIALVFLAMMAIIPGLQLIWAAIRGETDDLPSKWREYLAVAALVGIWLAVGHLYRAFGKVLTTTQEAGNEPDR